MVSSSDRDPWIAPRMRAKAKTAHAEHEIHQAVRAAMEGFLEVARHLVLDQPGALHAAANDSGEIPPGPPRPDAFPNEPIWLQFVDKIVMPVVGLLFGEEFRAAARRATISDEPYREAFLETARDRLRLWPRGVYEEIRYELLESHREGEGIPEQTARIGNVLKIDAPSRRLQAEISHVERELGEGDYPENPDLDPEAEPLLRSKRRELYEELDSDKGRWEWMAERIARTETMAALNGGSHDGTVALAEETGEVLHKQWLATDDDRTRDSHRIADGQTVPIAEPFTVGGFPLDHPGDPAGPAQEVIQCRCTALYLDEEEAPAALAAYETKLAEQAEAALTAAATQEDTMTEPAALPIGWKGVIAPMGVPTGDGRMLAVKTAQELRLRDMPLVFSSQEALSTGHQGSVITGNIQQVWVTKDLLIGGCGRFDLGSAEGQETARLLHEGFARWVSADPDDVLWGERWFGLDGNAVDPPTEEEWIAAEEAVWAGEPSPLDGRKLVMCMEDYRLVGATFVAQPAFNEAVIQPVYDEADLVPPEGVHVVAGTSLVAAAGPAAVLVAGAGPVKPPADWFAQPHLDGPTALHIADDGRVNGHLAVWDTCHTSFSSCVRPPRSASAYAQFHVGAVNTAEGATLPVGKITLGGGHADMRLGMRAAMSHYDDASAAVAVVRAYEDEFGIAVAGAIVPGVTEEQIAALRRSPLSGDWRESAGRLELIAAHAVNVPGFPVPRAMVASASASSDTTAAIVAAGSLPTEPVMTRLAGRIDRRRSTMNPEKLAKLVAREMREQERRTQRAGDLARKLGLDPAARAAAAAQRAGAAIPERIS